VLDDRPQQPRSRKEIGMTELEQRGAPVHDNFGHIQARPVSWVVVVLVCGGFAAAGIGLIVATPWLFFVGCGVVAVGTILGGVTHAMADMTGRAERSAARKSAADTASL
jgi:hypothetical protein